MLIGSATPIAGAALALLAAFVAIADSQATVPTGLSVIVRVTGADGNPAGGVRVGLVEGDDDLASARLNAVTRAQDGVAEIDLGHLDPSVVRWHDLRRGHWFVGLSVLDSSVVRVEVDPCQPPPAPIELLLPPTGRVVVQVVDIDGKPAPLDGTAVLSIQEESTRPAWQPQDPLRDRLAGWDSLRDVTSKAAIVAGRATFPHVGLGLELTLHVGLNVGPWQWVSGPGPRRGSDEVVFTIEAEEPGPWLVGRLLAADGRPCANQEVISEVFRPRREEDRHSGGSQAMAPWRSDALGRFRVDLSRIGIDSNDAIRLSLSDGHGSLSGHLRRDLPESKSRIIDLDDVLLPAMKVIATGAVVDDAGKAVAGVTVGFRMPEIEDGDGGDDENPVSPLTPDELASIECMRARSDEQGRFVVRGDVVPIGGIVYIRDAPGGFDERDVSVPFDSQHPEVQLTLVRCGAIEGRLYLDPGVDVDLVRVELTGPGLDRKRVAFDRDGALRSDGLPPGNWDVDILAGESWVSERLVERFTRIVVKPGETTRDPRLAAIDLRPQVRPVTLTVLAMDGAPIPSGVVSAWGDASDEIARVRDGTATFPLVAPFRDVEVGADGYRPLQLRRLATDATIHLEPGIPLRLRFRPEKLPFELGEVTFLAAQDRENNNPRFLSARIDARGEALVRLPFAGRYELMLWRKGPGGWLARDAVLVGLPPGAATIDVADRRVAAEEPIEIHLSDAAIRASAARPASVSTSR